MPQKYLEQICRPDQAVNPLFQHLGIEVLGLQPDKASLRLFIKPELIQGAGNAAGGILAALLDEAMAHAVLGGNQPGQLTSTVDMNVSFLNPVKQGDTLVCEGRVIKRGSRVVFVEASASNNGTEAARATGSFLLL